MSKAETKQVKEAYPYEAKEGTYKIELPQVMRFMLKKTGIIHKVNIQEAMANYGIEKVIGWGLARAIVDNASNDKTANAAMKSVESAINRIEEGVYQMRSPFILHESATEKQARAQAAERAAMMEAMTPDQRTAYQKAETAAKEAAAKVAALVTEQKTRLIKKG